MLPGHILPTTTSLLAVMHMVEQIEYTVGAKLKILQTPHVYLCVNLAREAGPRDQRAGLWAVLAAFFAEGGARDAEAHKGGGSLVLNGAEVANLLADVSETVGFIPVHPGGVYV